MLTTDHYYEIGRGHTVNQDYARSSLIKEEGIVLGAVAVVSDGCSSPSDRSNNNDISSRYLARRIESFSLDLLNLHEWAKTPHDSVREVMVAGIAKCQEEASIQNSFYNDVSFDATLVVAFYHKASDTLYCHVFGDGNIYLRSKDETKQSGKWYRFVFDNGAPYYLSYVGNEFERQYESRFGREYGRQEVYNIDGQVIMASPEEEVHHEKSFFLKIPDASKNYASVSVMSDGVETYRDATKDVKIPMHLVLDQFTQIKSASGDFLVRRMQNVKRFAEKNNWSHYDDISISTILF